MVEKIIVTPASVRGMGNIINPKESTDFTASTDYKIVESTDTVHGTETTVYGIESEYTVSFDSESYTTSSGSLLVEVTVLNGTTPVRSGTVTVTGAGGTGTGTTYSNGVAYITVTGITESGTLTATYKSAKATATLTYQPVTYSLAFSQDTYYTEFGEVTVNVTLKNNGVAMSGETITFNFWSSGTASTVTATTNSSGVATKYFDSIDVGPLTATYQSVTATCTIEEGF